VASPLQGLLTELVALATNQLVGRTVELSRPDAPIVARIERVALVPSDPPPAPTLDPMTWWIDTLDVATTGMARLLGLGESPEEPVGQIDVLESAELSVREVTTSGHRIDRVEISTVHVVASVGRKSLVRCGPVRAVATLTTDDVRTWLPPNLASLGRTLRLRADGRFSAGWAQGPMSAEVAGRVEPHAGSVDLVADRVIVAGREVAIPARLRPRRSLPITAVTALGAELRDVAVREGTVTVTVALPGWTEPITYDQLVRLQRNLRDRAGRVVVGAVRGRNR
jgi:hypothetical protein